MIKANTVDKNKNVTVEMDGKKRDLANEAGAIIEALFVKFDGDDRWTLFSLLTLTMMAAKAVIDGKAGNMDEAKNIVAKDIVKNAVNSFDRKETDDDHCED